MYETRRMSETRLLTRAEVADRLRLKDENTVSGLFLSKTEPLPFVPIGRKKLVLESDLESWITRRRRLAGL